MPFNKKFLFITALCGGVFFLHTFAQKEHKHEDETPVNLKVLPSNISHDELIKTMRGYSMALGVHCDYCHVSHKQEGVDRPKFDFASDDKPEKLITRDMMRMVMAINTTYLGKMKNEGQTLEQISCVTCHMGRTTPIVSVDSLMRK